MTVLGSRWRRLLTEMVFVFAAIWGAKTAAALTIELKDVAPDRIERQRAAAQGSLPLPGTPDTAKRDERLQEKGLAFGAPIFIRIFKAESLLEIWMQKDAGYTLFAAYPICHWSGTLGPKLKEGDRQTPEGFYTVGRRQLHRYGRWPGSLNIGYPNVFDRSQSRGGSSILVHGGCSSVGCLAMTNPVIEEVYRLTEAAIRGGQGHVPVHVFPFRMTEANIESHKESAWHTFWLNLKEGYDRFERTRRPPRVSVCGDQYRFQHTLNQEEAADPGPLTDCRLMAVAARKFETLAMVQLSRAIASASAGIAMPLVVAAVGSAADRLQHSLARIATGSQKAAAQPDLKPNCSLARASCRKHVYLQQRSLATAAGKLQKQKATRTATRAR